MKKLRVEVWSDIACPWCYVGKRRLDSAIARFPQAGAVDVVWRAFELDPAAPRVRDRSVSYAERLAKKYGTDVAKANVMLQRMTDVAAGDGLDFHFERVQSGNTFDAHRVLHLAGDRGLQHVTKERFLRAYMTEGEPIGEPEVLVRLGGEAGLDTGEIRRVLAGDAYAEAVRDDEETARQLGISGVPFFAIAGRYGVSGAQSAEALLEVLAQAWAEQSGPEIVEGAVCGPAGCT
ncbi:MAG: DsbA family oxidoreductase [Polyangiaceae bacterium]|jgi:predicted DsbA family dithiol-disulfide isomerase